ncbi:G protein [Almendravirus arboretum]|uniref:G protein n=1 Tax=Almendravirus arboretum TaxID=1972683 RepID=X4R558_9RHAB|nr:G protein [Almendravirus arboretum]AHU86498.1 G protein [Almendravirus arboretum]
MIAHKLILPLVILTSFQRIKREDITCPVYNHKNVNVSSQSLLQFDMRQVSFNSGEEIINHNPLVTGYLCRKLSYETSCYANLFTSNTVEYKLKILPITKKECATGSNSQVKSFPTPICNWSMFGSNTVKETKQYIEYEQRSYKLDMVSGKLKHVEEIFDKCYEEYCVLKDNSGYWIRDDQDEKKYCPKLEDQKIPAKLKVIDQFEYLEVAQHIYDMQELCALEVCGNMLIHIPDIGNFIGDDRFMKKLKKCKSLPSLRNAIENNSEDITGNEKCLDFRLKMLGNPDKSIKYHDIRNLHPRSPGINRVYRLGENNTLESAIAYYGSTGLDKISKKLNYWVNCTEDKVCSYNGYMGKDKLHLRSKLDSETYQDIFEVDDELIVYQPTRNISESFYKDVIHYELLDKMTQNFSIFNSNYYSKIIYALLIILAVFFIYKIMKLLTLRCFKNQSKFGKFYQISTNKSQELDMMRKDISQWK